MRWRYFPCTLYTTFESELRMALDGCPILKLHPTVSEDGLREITKDSGYLITWPIVWTRKHLRVRNSIKHSYHCGFRRKTIHRDGGMKSRMLRDTFNSSWF
jgi:hypothetical protein